MSALGQKQTSAHVRVMSALPPIADIDQHGPVDNQFEVGWSLHWPLRRHSIALKVLRAFAVAVRCSISPAVSAPTRSCAHALSPSGSGDWVAQACHTVEALATFFGQTVTSSLFRHWTMIGMESVLSPV